MIFVRGSVFFTPIELPNPENPGLDLIQNKLIVILRDVKSEMRVPFLIASSLRSEDIRPFEVVVRQTESSFKADTVIDCRWPYTMTRARLEKGKFLFTLPDKIMAEINLGLVVGLQM